MNTSQQSSRPSSFKSHLSFFVLLAFLLVISFIAALLFGSTQISLFEMLEALFGKGEKNTLGILIHIRLPRALGAIFSGAALACAGVIIQAVLNNPMAAPNIIGVNSGAGLAAVILLTLFPRALAFLPLAAFIGALSCALLIYAVSYKTGAGRLTLTLVGIALSSILNAAINALKVIFPDSVYDADLFMIGGFSSLTLNKLFPAVIIISASLAISFIAARYIDVLCLGRNVAESLGVNTSKLRFILIVLAAALAGAAVSFAGLLGFVGLLVPHIVRRFVGEKHLLLLPGSAIAGAVLVLICDTLSRVVFAPYEIPVGILLSLIGGAFFILLILMRGKNA